MVHHSPRVLIVDKRSVMGVDMCRTLAAQACRCEIFAEPGSPAFFSRFCTKRWLSPPFEDRREFLAALDIIVGRSPYDAIHVCHEEIMAWILPLIGEPRWRGLLLPPSDRIKTALSKNAMLTLVAKAGVATPRTVIPNHERELAGLVKQFGSPVVVKGDTGESGETVRLAWNTAELFAKYREVRSMETRAGSRPSVQEFVRGPAFSIGGLYYDGEPLRVLVHRKLLRYPYPWGGRTVRGVTEDCPDVRSETFKVFRALQYSGLGHAEFIRDERDGKLKFLEVNARPWGTIGVARWAGVDLFTPYRRLVEGQRVEPDLRYKSGVVFHSFSREIRLMFERPARVAGFLIDAANPRVRSNFQWTDPGPHMPTLSLMARLRSVRSEDREFGLRRE